MGKLLKQILKGIGIRRPKRRLYNPFVRTERRSAKRINFLLRFSAQGKRYLEVGVFTARTFEAVRAEWKVGVDPNPLFYSGLLPRNVDFFRQTSDEFFQGYAGPNFDVIFLDGLHEAQTTYRDFVGACNRLNDGGVILIDDVLPSDRESSLPNRDDSDSAKLEAGISHSRWYGDVWRVAWLVLKRYPDFEICFVGDGIREHCQAVVRRKTPATTKLIAQDDDLAFMNKLDYTDVVESGPGALRGLAQSENVALDRLSSLAGCWSDSAPGVE